MRVLLLGLLLCVSLVSGQTITRQGYASGTTTAGGCSGINPADSVTYTFGQCYNNTQNTPQFLSSIKYNDCWGNGVFTMTRYKGSATCAPQNALQVIVGIASIGSANASTMCNGNNGGAAYNTYVCSAVTTAPVNYTQVLVNSFPIGTPDTGCSGTNSTTTTVNIGQCTTIPAAGSSSTDQYVISNCVDGLVTSVSYTTPDCSLQYDATSTSITSTQTPFLPFNQVGSTAGNGKLIGAAASTCANSTGVHFSFTCVAPVTPTTATPTTATPTTATPTTATPTTVTPTGPTTAAPTGPTTMAPTGPTTAAPTTAAPTTAAPTTPAPNASSSSSSTGGKFGNGAVNTGAWSVAVVALVASICAALA